VLGPQLKYSSAFWPEGIESLPEAEEVSLRETSEHADLHAAVMDEMAEQDKYRRKLSSNGKSDGKINYLEAKIAVVSKMAKATKRKNPLEKNEGVSPENLGGGTSSKIPSKSGPSVKLDSFAAEFVKDRKMSEESVKKALSKELPSQLAGAGK